MDDTNNDAVGIPLFRLTLLGPRFSGKTSIVNSLLNNVFSSVYKHTLSPELYYFVLRLSYDEPLVNATYDDINAFCFEIEDTCVESDLNILLDLRKESWSFEEDVKDYTPFKLYKAPIVPLHPYGQFKPISQGRMCFLVVFDVNSRESFTSATPLIEYLLNLSENIGDGVPVVGLVANKIDLVQPDIDLLDEAATFAQSKTIPFYRVSALTKRNIHKMIREIAFLIYGNVNLWEIVIRNSV